jgi:hypothetical protein
MATRNKAELQKELDELSERLKASEREKSELRQALEAEKAKTNRLETEMTQMKATLDTVAHGHITSEKRVAALEKAVADLSRSQSTAATRTPAPPYLAATRAGGQGPPQRPAPPVARQPPRTEPQQGTDRFVVRAPVSNTPDEVLATLADRMGVNKSALGLVQKLMPRPSSQPPPPAIASSSTVPAPPPTTPHATFIVTTSAFIVDKAVKGDLRKQLRDRNIPMYVDDYLTKEQQQERNSRLQEKKDLKAAGTTVAWRKATLWKLIKEGDKDVWQLVPAPAPGVTGGAAAESAPAVT